METTPQPAEHFPWRDGELLAGGCLVRELAKRYQTPLFVYDGEVAGKKWSTLRAALPARFEICYSMKANPQPAFLRLFCRREPGSKSRRPESCCRLWRPGADRRKCFSPDRASPKRSSSWPCKKESGKSTRNRLPNSDDSEKSPGNWAGGLPWPCASTPAAKRRAARCAWEASPRHSGLTKRASRKRLTMSRRTPRWTFAASTCSLERRSSNTKFCSTSIAGESRLAGAPQSARESRLEPWTLEAVWGFPILRTNRRWTWRLCESGWRS